MINISTGFQVNSSSPVDARFSVEDIAERDNIPIPYRYKGLICYVRSTDQLFLLYGGTDNINWIDITALVTNGEQIAAGLFQTEELIPNPCMGAGGWNGHNNRSSTTNEYEGGSYFINSFGEEFNRFRFRASNANGNSTVRILIYQRPDGDAGVAPKILEVEQAIPNGGGLIDITIPPTNFVRGYAHILWTKLAGGSLTARVYNTSNVDMYNSINTFTDMMVSTFLSNFAFSDPVPPTLDPTKAGGQIVESGGTDVALICRLFKI